MPDSDLSPQTPADSSAPSPTFFSRGLLVKLIAIAAVIVAAVYLVPRFWSGLFADPESQVSTGVAKIVDLRDLIVEQGTLESQNTVNGVCEIEGYENKIIFIMPEGTRVKKGDVVVKFDDSQILKNITEHELVIAEAKSDVEDAKQEVTVQQNENESSIRAAKQELEFAKIDLNKYLEGDFLVSKSDLEGAISEADTAVKKAERELETMRIYYKRGFRQLEQLREAEQMLESAKLRLQRDEQKYDMLLRFEHKKKKAELEGKATEADFKLSAAQETAKAKLAKANDRLDYRVRRLDMQEKRMERYKKNLKKFVIQAPQAGTVAYPTQNMYGPDRQIREGAVVYQNQTVFYLPNLSEMQVKVGIHESLVSKVKPGQRATVRIDAFPTQAFLGRVKKIAPLAESNFFSSAKNYTAIVTIDEIPEGIALKPGMTAQVEILAGIYPDVLAVPMQAIASNFGRKYVYVLQANGSFERRKISVGKSNVSFVEVTSGLEAGEKVALDAFQRGIEDFGKASPEKAISEEDGNEESTVVENPESPAADSSTEQPLAPTSTEDVPASTKEKPASAPEATTSNKEEAPTSTKDAAAQPATDNDSAADKASTKPAKDATAAPPLAAPATESSDKVEKSSSQDK